MKVKQSLWRAGDAWPWQPSPLPEAQLVFLFGATSVFQREGLIDGLRAGQPQAIFVGCTTAGEIHDAEVTDDALSMTSVHFDHTRLRVVHSKLSSDVDSRSAGQQLARELAAPDLVHVFVLSDGLAVNGSELVRGMVEALPASVTLTGGLAGDGARFATTLVCADATPEAGLVAAVAFYGDRLVVGHGSLGGWDPFGPERIVTRSQGNVLFELDGQSALSLYKQYLGDHADELPASALLFPLEMRIGTGGHGLVRTVLNVSEADQSMTFAGDIPEGARIKLMKANFDRLVVGAEEAAQSSNKGFANTPIELAILISCVGRKLVLKQRIDEEVEAVREVLGEKPVMAGFYSYGEISPFAPSARCELHNQTMTITTFGER